MSFHDYDGNQITPQEWKDIPQKPVAGPDVVADPDGKEYSVYTRWSGIDHNPADGPQIYEVGVTAMFEFEDDQEELEDGFHRWNPSYRTAEEAQEEHDRVVAAIEAGERLKEMPEIVE